MHLVTFNGFVICELAQSVPWIHRYYPHYTWQWILKLNYTLYEESHCFFVLSMPSSSVLQCPLVHVQEETVNEQFPPYSAHNSWDLISRDSWKAFDNILHEKLFKSLCFLRIGKELLSGLNKELRFRNWGVGINSPFSQCRQGTSRVLLGYVIGLPCSKHF